MNRNLSRRSALCKITQGAATLAAVASLPPRLQAADDTERLKLKGNIHHSASAWCYGSLFNGSKDKPGKMTFEDYCRECAKMGLESVELLGPDKLPAVKKAGLTCAMCNGPDTIPYGWNAVATSQVSAKDVAIRKLESNNEEQKWIHIMHQWRKTGMSYDRIAKELNRMGVPPKTPKGTARSRE